MTEIGPGSIVGESRRYRLDRLLGTGGMATVWRATDTRLDRTVAIKLLADVLALDDEYLRRFAREGRIAARLSHPHLVGVYDVGVHHARPFLVMEHIPGGTLAQRLADARGGWDPVVLARELISAVGYVHTADILHRDIKPANVLIDADGRARLTDFGIAQATGATQLTAAHKVIGTWQYLAPELLAGSPASAASDMYSLGVLLSECANAQPAPELRRAIAAMTDPDPRRRPRTALQALALLESPQRRTPAVPQRPVADPASTLPTATTRARSASQSTEAPRREVTHLRSNARSGIAAAGVLVVAILALILLTGTRTSPPPPLTATPPNASITQQLTSLDQAIDHARR